MSVALPVVRGPSTALYPFVQRYVCHTGISDAQNGSATRWVQAPPTVRFEFPYVPLTQAQKNTLKAAFAAGLGQFGTAFTATTDQTYSGLSFDSDDFSAVERASTQYGVKWALSQTISQSFSPGASGGAYPTLAAGNIGELPYTQRQRFKTIVSGVACGSKYTQAEYGGGFSNYPTTGLMSWIFEEHALTDAEVATKTSHFLAQFGNAFPFTYTDEDGTNYSKVFYGSPELVINRLQYNISSITTQLVATF